MQKTLLINLLNRFIQNDLISLEYFFQFNC